MKAACLILILIPLVFAADAVAGQDTGGNHHSEASINAVEDAAVSYREAQRNRALAVAPIRSEDDLFDHLSKLPSSETGSPFLYFSEKGRSRFVDSLKFGDGGLASFDYSSIQRELTVRQAYELLGLFGFQDIAASIPGLEVKDEADRAILKEGDADFVPLADYKDYECIGMATCAASNKHICIGVNCKMEP